VGKIGTSGEILRKPGRLTDEERKEMQRHTVIGHEILTNSESKLLRIAATIALTHHERFDGTGYPAGLAGKEIPLDGRIAAVADVFDALLTDRCYRPAKSVAEAVAMMEEGRGTQFDPRIVDVLLGHIDEALALRG
jgi:putative two-component system response regulator